jgi:hypothetical protein
VSSIDELFAEVYANPDDDQLRRVLADALLSINDPRGELILFQLEPEKDDHRRAMRLIQAHGLSWLGPLRGFVVPLSYERGFLASCQLIGDATLELDFDHPVWATVHTIDLGELARFDRFEITPAMRSLRKLTRLSDVLRDQLRRDHPEAAARLGLELHVPEQSSDEEHFDGIAE